METNVFSNETLNAAVKAMDGSQTEIQKLREQAKNEPISEVVQRYLMDKLNMTQSEAEEICNDIQQGISEFDAQFAANSSTEKVNLREKLESVIENMEEEKRVKYLSGILTAFQVAQQQEMSPEEISSLQEANAKRSVEELIDEIENLFDENFSVEKLAEFVDANVDATAIAELARQIDMSKEEYRLLAAAILCVGQHNGSVKLSDEPIPASLLGALASAGVETIKLTGDLKEGKIDLKQWQVVLKWILGAIVSCALGCVAIMMISFMAGVIADFVLTIFGTGLLAVFAALAITLYLSWDFTKYTVDGIAYLLEVLADVYDQYVEPVTQKVKKWVAVVKKWFTALGEKVKDEVTPSENKEETEPTTVVQPSMVTV